MKYILFLSLGLALKLGLLYGQDQIIYTKGDADYVDRIDSIFNDSLIFTSFKKSHKVPLTKIKGYYITVKTAENLKKGYYKRERIYYEIDSKYHVAKKNKITDYVIEYINSHLPENLSSLSYSDGYYIGLNNDTTFCEISYFENSDDNYIYFVSRDDSLNYKIFNALMVRGYSVRDKVFASYMPSSENTKVYMFICRQISGKMELYTKASLPFDKYSYYLINKIGSSTFYPISTSDGSSYILSVDGQNMVINSKDENYRSVIRVTYQDMNLNNSFKELMPKLVSDCPLLSSKIQVEFYTKSDLLQIVREYNDCR
jgi:hypothetical protein